jgi:Na+/melibiose symporter-like transporter
MVHYSRRRPIMGQLMDDMEERYGNSPYVICLTIAILVIFILMAI